MINSTGSSTTTQSARGLLNNIPSRVAGWFRGKFASIATKIKCLLPRAGSTHISRQVERTSIDARRVSSDSQEQDFSSVVTTFSTRLLKNDLPVLNVAVLQQTYVEVLGPITQKISELVEDLKTEAGSAIKTYDHEANTIDQLRRKFSVNHSALLEKGIHVSESFIKDRNDYIESIKGITVEQRDKFVSSLEFLDRLHSLHIDKAAEVCDLGKNLTLHNVHDGSKLAREEEVRSLQSKVLYFHLMLNDLNKDVRIEGLIASDTNLNKKFSDIRQVLDNLMLTLKIIA